MNHSRYAHVDALRAIAVLLVIWMHASEVFAPLAQVSYQHQLFDVAHFFDFGRIGVVVFFIISGFVIPASLRGDQAGAWKAFILKRFFRLFPLYWLSLPFGLMTTWWIWGKDISMESIVWNLSMVQELAGHPSIQGLYWTLQVELIFYAACLLLFLAGGLHSTFCLAVMVTALSVPPVIAWGGGWVGLSLPFELSAGMHLLLVYLSLMFWGTLLRSAYEGRMLGVAAWVVIGIYPVIWLAAAVLSFGWYLSDPGKFSVLHTFLPYAIAIVAFFVFVFLLPVRSAFIVWLGTISYSLYLFHPVAQYSLSWIVQYADIPLFKGWSLASYMASTAILAVFISALTHSYVELPFQRLGNALAARDKVGIKTLV